MATYIKKILITGGAGFIGSNTAAYYLNKGVKVAVLDNLSRPGARLNVKWLASLGGKLEIVKADIRYNQRILNREVERADAVIHLAAQVAATTSVRNPREDFETNAVGTFNLLEAIRNSKRKPPFIYSSTNKVYGNMENVKVKKLKTRYAYVDYEKGISEDFPLDFHSPYGCSKGAADQYTRDYARIYGLPTVVFRQSSIYGPRQFGMEDQGWIAWFIIAALLDRQINLDGDGLQVRDVLYINDLVELFDTTLQNIDKVKGEVFNVGGGHKMTLSVWSEFEPMLREMLGKKVKIKYFDWRPGDQRIYVSDIRKVRKFLGWEPKTTVEEGVEKFFNWAKNNKKLFEVLK